ncbi:MAG: hypothetical protein P8Y65_10620 [Campylobacterales bacterium]
MRFNMKNFALLVFSVLISGSLCSADEATHWLRENEYLKLSSGCKYDHRLLSLTDVQLNKDLEKQTSGMVRKKTETKYYEVNFKTAGSGLPQKVDLCLYGENKRLDDETFKTLASYISYIDTDILKIYLFERDEYKYLVLESRAMGASGLMMSYHSFVALDLGKGIFLDEEAFSTAYYNPFYFTIKDDGRLEAILLHSELLQNGEKVCFAVENEFEK